MTCGEENRDLFSVPEEYHLAHCISADFALGKGIALQFNQRFDLKRRLRENHPGYLERFPGGDCILEGRVLNLVTKRRYFHKPTLGTMETALEKMRELCLHQGIVKVAMPRIGAGLDRLSWEDTAALIRTVFQNTEVEILVCTPENSQI
ncbi:MAG: macro domain-containing protein [Angelakisella sp.]|jgi:O-acetyl-ADP-ribose deacetylase (regulator of RNase III)|nr:macro domain-containing protein [Angelakisella sp.]